MAKGKVVTQEGTLVAATPAEEATLVMAPATNLVGVRQAVEQLHLLKTERWSLEYDRRSDTFHFRGPKQGPAISYFMPGLPELIFRLDAATGHLSGIDVEQFRRAVMATDPNWRSLYAQYRLTRVLSRVPQLQSILDTLARGLQALASDAVASTASARSGLQAG